VKKVLAIHRKPMSRPPLPMTSAASCLSLNGGERTDGRSSRHDRS
jgi:hypothetical protein